MSRFADKSRRRQTILDLLRRRSIGSQGELARLLATRGHSVNQSTLSRDLKDLRVVRVPGEEGYRYLPAGEEGGASGGGVSDEMRRVTAAEVLSLGTNETVVVVRTQVGRAPGVAAFLDAQRPVGVLATVAGDDTVLVIPKSVSKTAALARRLSELFELS